MIGIQTAALLLGVLGAQSDYRPVWQNWAIVTIDGWQTTCSTKTQPEGKPTKCTSIFALDNGVVILTYTDATLNVSVIGDCGNDVGRSRDFNRPISEVVKAVEDVARLGSKDCKSPVLTSAMFQGLPQLNVILTVLTERGR